MLGSVLGIPGSLRDAWDNTVLTRAGNDGSFSRVACRNLRTRPRAASAVHTLFGSGRGA